MAEIKLTINGRVRNVNLTRIDWTEAQRLNGLYGSTPLPSDALESVTDCIMQSTVDAAAKPSGDADDAFYIFRTSHGSNSLLSGLVPLADQLGTRVLYYGARQKTGDSIMSFFHPAEQQAPANADLDLHNPEQVIYSSIALTPGSAVPVIQNMIYKTGADTSGLLACYNSAAVIQTDAGGLFGASMCQNAAGENAVILWSFGRYGYRITPNYAARGNYWYEWGGSTFWYPSINGHAMLSGVPLNGDGYNATVSAPYIETEDDVQIDDCISAEMIYTEIGGKPYLGLAACKWLNGAVIQLDVALLPGWFWGDYQTPPSENPADIDQYHGYDAAPEKTSGTYSYTMADITLPTNPQPFSGMTATEHGLHVYSISQSDYNEILGSLWGDGGLAESIWRKFRNYKFNPVAGVIACHKMPSELMPTSTAIVQVKAAGCPLMSISSAHDITSKAYIDGSSRTLRIPKYFSSHLNYDPYSSIQMFLPFCGWMIIPADRVVGGSISVQYRADVVTGNVCAFIRCFDGDGKNTACYQMTGNAALSVPVTGNDNGVGTVLGAVTASAGLAAAALTGGIGGAALIAGAAGAGLATQTARNAIQTGTQYSGNVAALGCLQPFVLITLPVEHTSEEYRELHGLPSGIGLTVGQLSGTGYTEMAEFHADFECMETEQAEIERIMKEGVIL